MVVDYDNPENDFWETYYKLKHFRSAATVGNVITIYKHEYDVTDDYIRETLEHEIAHDIDHRVRLSGKKWRKAIDDDYSISGILGPTDYTRQVNKESPNDTHEDVADSVMVFEENTREFRKKFPNRYSILMSYMDKINSNTRKG